MPIVVKPYTERNDMGGPGRDIGDSYIPPSSWDHYLGGGRAETPYGLSLKALCRSLLYLLVPASSIASVSV